MSRSGGIQQGPGADPGVDGLAHTAIAVLPAAAHLDQTTTGWASGQQARQTIDPDVTAREGNAAARAAG